MSSKLKSQSSKRSSDKQGASNSFISTTKRVRKSLVVVGDGMIGKSCLLQVYVNGEFYENYQPTVFENCCVDIPVSNTAVVDMTIHDTAGMTILTSIVCNQNFHLGGGAVS